MRLVYLAAIGESTKSKLEVIVPPTYFYKVNIMPKQETKSMQQKKYRKDAHFYFCSMCRKNHMHKSHIGRLHEIFKTNHVL